MSDRLTLSDILGRGISMEWYEGVALVRGVAERLLDAANQATAVPELHHIEISAAGQVNVTGGTIASEPVRRLGQLLQATLGHTTAPVQLRLFIVQATTPPPAPSFGSIREFDEALGYFERPGRDTVLQALYARAAAATPISSAELPTLDAVAPLSSPEQPKAPQRRASAKSKPAAMKIAGVAVILVVVGASGVWYSRGIGAEKRDMSTIAVQASNAVGAAVVSGLSVVTEGAGLGRLVSANETGMQSPAAPEAPVKASRGDRAPAPVSPPPATFPVFDLGPVPTDVVETPVSVDPIAAPVTEFMVIEVEGEPPTYSPQSEGVTPPVAVRPQLPSELPSSLTPEQLYRVELIVSEDGTVDSVRLLGMPHTVHDFMFLSAAKAWQFHPALKDGVPVRYRKTVWIASQ